jgi:multiple sugar transport system substrate-binding protein
MVLKHVLLSLLRHGVVALLVLSTAVPPSQAADHPLKGKKIDMSILGIGGWLPSRLGVDMSPMFAKYAKDKYGYDVSFTFAEAPFSALFQKAASTLATRSQEYNIIISDSQWLGAFAEPRWIVKVSDLLKQHPEFNIEWYNKAVRESYQVYPDGSNDLWGLPEEGDTVALFVRKDLFQNPAEKTAFKAKYGMELPQTFEDWEKISFAEMEKIAEFFTRPDKGLYGTELQYSKEYDFMSMYLYPFMFSMGGDIWDPKDRKIYGILNSDVNAEAMVWNKRFLKYQPPGAITYGIGENIDAFTQGKVATAFQWAAVGLAMINDKNRDKVIVVPPPGFRQKDGSVKRLYCIGGQPWVINAFNDKAHMTVAIDFLKWFYLPATQLDFAKRGGNPAVKAVLETPGFDDIQPWFRAYKFMLRDRSRDFWHEAKYSEMLAAQQEAFTAYATGQVSDPKVALEWAACEQQKILFEAGRTKMKPPDACKNAQLK